jgi:fumarate hydratase class I
MVGKSERGPEAIASIKAPRRRLLHRRRRRRLSGRQGDQAGQGAGLPGTGHGGVYEFEVENMPVTVAVDSTGNSVHDSGPREWRMKIGKIPLATH